MLKIIITKMFKVYLYAKTCIDLHLKKNYMVNQDFTRKICEKMVVYYVHESIFQIYLEPMASRGLAM